MFGGLIDFTRQELLESKHVLMTALREGRKFIDLFLSAKSTKFISAMFYEKENQVEFFIYFFFFFFYNCIFLCLHSELYKCKKVFYVTLFYFMYFVLSFLFTMIKS